MKQRIFSLLTIIFTIALTCLVLTSCMSSNNKNDEMLKALKEKGKKIAIASSKPKQFVDEISQHLGIFDYYDYVSAESFDKTHSSKEELINNVLEHFGNPDKSKCLMIGDRFYDIDGAKATGLESAGAIFGLGEVKELTEAGATYLLNDPMELVEFW